MISPRPDRDAHAATDFLRFAVVTLAASLTLASSAWGQLAPQPANSHSFLMDNTGRSGIRDDDFARLIMDALIVNGQSNVKDAKFLFQQCFGGGMLDDLQRALGNNVSWVGGAASTWWQPSYGQLTQAEAQALRNTERSFIANQPGAFWTNALLPELANQNLTMLQAINNARDKDQVGINNGLKDRFGRSIRLERGQSVSANGGQNITLKDAAAKSHHAILFAGKTDYASIFNGMEAMRNTLIQQWGAPGPTVSITMLYGDGAHKGSLRNIAGGGNLPAAWNAQPATAQNLRNTLAALPLNANEEFFFYGFDHGGSNINIRTTPGRVRVPGFGGRDDEPFSLMPEMLTGMLDDPDNTPTLTVNYGDLNTQLEVWLNGFLVGTLDPAVSLSGIEFDLREEWLGLDNVVRIVNNSSSDIEFDLNLKDFFTGAVAPDPIVFVSVPPSLTLIVIGIGALMSIRFRRQRKTLHACGGTTKTQPDPRCQCVAKVQ